MPRPINPDIKKKKSPARVSSAEKKEMSRNLLSIFSSVTLNAIAPFDRDVYAMMSTTVH